MSISIVCSWTTLMRYAKALGDAKKSGDIDRICEAQKVHDNYRDLCLRSDRMINGEIYE